MLDVPQAAFKLKVIATVSESFFDDSHRSAV